MPLPLAAAASDAAVVFIELGVVTIGLAAVARLAARSEFSPIPLYLLVGLALSALAPFEFDEGFVDLAGQIGVILLLLMLGLEYTADELRTNLRAGLPAGGVDLALNFTPGVVAGFLLGWEPLAALLLGGVTYISSSGVIAKVLADLGRVGNRETPAILSILVTEDLAMAVYLPVMAALLVGGGLLAVAGSVAVAVTAAAVVLFVALRFGEQMSRAIAHPSDEVVLLTAFGLVLVVAGLAEQLQVSAAVGAFLLGIALSGQLADRVRELLTPLRDLFAAAFFLFFGLQIDAATLPGVALAAGLLALVTLVTKVYTGWWAARRAGVAPRGRLRAGTALVARGEFSIVIAGIGVAGGVEPRLGALAAAYVLILALAGPLLTRYADQISIAWQGRRRSRAGGPSVPTIEGSGAASARR